MIELTNVCLRYRGQTVLSDQDLRIAPGERVALMGPSGCGKTSLLRLVAGLVKPTAGTLRVSADRIAFLFQEPRLLPWLTAEENVNTVLSDRAATLPEARRWLEAVGLSPAAKKYPRELSGGMQQRLSLARALASGGSLLLLDEPLKGLDDETRADMLALLQTHAAEKTLLLATHDRTEAEALAHRRFLYHEKSFQNV